MTVDSREIKRGFVSHGQFIAVPLVFPSVTTPIPHDNSYVTALAVPEHGARVYGGTKGAAAHVFMAATRSPCGYVMDLGVVPEATEVVSVMLADSSLKTDVLFVTANTAGGWKIITFPYSGSQDGIQEWSFRRPEYRTVGEGSGGILTDSVMTEFGVLCLGDDCVFLVDREGGGVTELATGKFAINKIGVTESGNFVALADGKVMKVDSSGKRLVDAGFSLPFGGTGWGWASGGGNTLLCASSGGEIFSLDITAKSSRSLGQTLIPPVKAMAATSDGRAFGLCGEGIGRFFRVNLGGGEAEDLGPVAAVFGAKRYAYTFSCAAVGRDGEMYFGEDDRGGHLWIYYPPLKASLSETGGVVSLDASPG